MRIGNFLFFLRFCLGLFYSARGWWLRKSCALGFACRKCMSAQHVFGGHLCPRTAKRSLPARARATCKRSSMVAARIRDDRTAGWKRLSDLAFCPCRERNVHSSNNTMRISSIRIASIDEEVQNSGNILRTPLRTLTFDGRRCPW